MSSPLLLLSVGTWGARVLNPVGNQVAVPPGAYRMFDVILNLKTLNEDEANSERR
ncbi:unnamed protein product [Dovyalis caffra]|uniref:Uncharacterized protein n=1 Tax=Dovyalis caffra TaxID=77055 RepID=A0AAV1S185_9ROSI|nr:unnamed protein product [Dovyalis caffra]